MTPIEKQVLIGIAVQMRRDVIIRAHVGQMKAVRTSSVKADLRDALERYIRYKYPNFFTIISKYKH